MGVQEGTSLIDVVILIVFAQAINVWWSADSPYNGAKQMSQENLHRYEIGASAMTILFGLVASVLTKRSIPVIFSVALALAFVWLYEHEWARENVKGEDVNA